MDRSLQKLDVESHAMTSRRNGASINNVLDVLPSPIFAEEEQDSLYIRVRKKLYSILFARL